MCAVKKCSHKMSITNNVMHICVQYVNLFVSWLRGRSKENCAYISHVAQVSDTAQVTRQVSLFRINISD